MKPLCETIYIRPLVHARGDGYTVFDVIPIIMNAIFLPVFKIAAQLRNNHLS